MVALASCGRAVALGAHKGRPYGEMRREGMDSRSGSGMTEGNESLAAGRGEPALSLPKEPALSLPKGLARDYGHPGVGWYPQGADLVVLLPLCHSATLDMKV